MAQFHGKVPLGYLEFESGTDELDSKGRCMPSPRDSDAIGLGRRLWWSYAVPIRLSERVTNFAA